MRACLHIVDCTKSDTCAEKEYRERDSSCEVKLRLPTVAAAAAAATYRMWLFIFVIYEAEQTTFAY